jgi:membrane protease subunit HflK
LPEVETYKKIEKLAYGSVAFLIAYTGLCIFGSMTPGGLCLRAVAFFSGIGVLICALSAFHAKLRLLAEREDADRQGTDEDESLFEESAVTSRVRLRNLQQFERWMIPAVVGFIGVVELISAIFLFKSAGSVVPIVSANIAAVVGCAAVGGVAAFLFSSYLVGISSSGPQRIIRAAAGELAGLAWLSAASAMAFLLTLTKVSANFDLAFGRVFATLLLLRAVERGFAVVMDIYRPRKKIDVNRPMLYESRVNGIVADPKGLLAGVSEGLHYQFGIRVDESGLLKILTVGLPIIILGNVLVLIVASTAVVVNPGERAVLERWGRPHATRAILEPGMHFKMPWPIDRVYRHNVRKVRTVNVQKPAEDRGLWGSANAAGIDLYWTSADGPDLSKAGLNALAVELFVEYRIDDVATYLYGSRDPESALKSLARRELTLQLGGERFFDSFLDKRAAIATAARKGLQEAVNDNGLGIEVVSVGLRYVQPPTSVVESFREVVAKEEQGLGQILEAKRDVLNKDTDKQSEADGWVSDAQAYKDQRVGMARADLASFERIQPLHAELGKLLKARMYFDAMKGMTNRRKIILATDIERQMIRLDLKKSKSELFEFTEETSK